MFKNAVSATSASPLICSATATIPPFLPTMVSCPYAGDEWDCCVIYASVIVWLTWWSSVSSGRTCHSWRFAIESSSLVHPRRWGHARSHSFDIPPCSAYFHRFRLYIRQHADFAIFSSIAEFSAARHCHRTPSSSIIDGEAAVIHANGTDLKMLFASAALSSMVRPWFTMWRSWITHRWIPTRITSLVFIFSSRELVHLKGLVSSINILVIEHKSVCRLLRMWAIHIDVISPNVRCCYFCLFLFHRCFPESFFIWHFRLDGANNSFAIYTNIAMQ